MKASLEILFLIVAITHICRCLKTNDPIQERKKVLLKKLADDHDTRITPSMTNGSGGGGDVEVEVSFEIQDISISDYDMEFGVQAVVQQQWIDDRLKYDSNSVAVDALTVVGQSATSAFWTPDIHFVNDQGEQQRLNPFLKIQPSGHVLYSYSISLTLPCQMDLQKFPFDSQICTVEIGCRGFANDDVKFVWGNRKKIYKSHQLKVKDGFVIVDILTSSCFPESFRDSRLRVAVVLRRALVFFALRVFLPSIALVLFSWLSPVPLVRLLAAILGLGLMASVTSEMDAAMPRLDHLTAADLWTSACSLLLLVSVFDVFHARGALPPPLQADGVTSVRMKQLLTPGEPAQEMLPVTRWDRLTRALPNGGDRHSYARLLLPPLFVVFSFLYFTAYLLIRD